jgi:hypothetical protein
LFIIKVGSPAATNCSSKDFVDAIRLKEMTLPSVDDCETPSSCCMARSLDFCLVAGSSLHEDITLCRAVAPSMLLLLLVCMKAMSFRGIGKVSLSFSPNMSGLLRRRRSFKGKSIEDSVDVRDDEPID